MLFTLRITPEAWPAERKKLKRKGARYVTVAAQPHGMLFVAGSCPSPVGLPCVDLDGFMMACGAAVKAISAPEGEAKGTRFRPVNFCVDWPAEEKEGDWERVGPARKDCRCQAGASSVMRENGGQPKSAPPMPTATVGPVLHRAWAFAQA